VENSGKDISVNLKMLVLVRGQQTHSLEFTGGESVNNLKAQISQLEAIPEDDVVLYMNGTPLDDDSALVSSLQDASVITIDVTARLLGGKVHGSLARAGKVKGQTPKVEKQPKRRVKTGRAQRRMQYNRRFVNVVAGFGKRKGPNSNS